MRKINISFVNDSAFSLGFGGKEIQLLSYERYLESLPQFSVNRLDFWNKASLDFCDVLHFFGSSKGLHTMVRAAKLQYPKVKIVISPNFFVQHEFLEFFASKTLAKLPIPNVFSYRRELFNFADLLIVNSESEKSQLRQTYVTSKQDGPNILVVKNGVEDDFYNLKDRDLFCRHFLVEPGYFLAVAFLDERKNSLRLLKAFVRTLATHKKNLILIGGFRFSSKSLLDECELIIKKHPDRIIHIPYIDRSAHPEILKSAYANCCAHLLPSILETPGISTLEALVFGRPVLVGECKPVRDYFGESVRYCNPYSEEDIEKGIIALSTDQASIKLDSISKRFFWGEILKSLPEIYHRLVYPT